jgi:hypothetical protein
MVTPPTGITAGIEFTDAGRDWVELSEEAEIAVEVEEIADISSTATGSTVNGTLSFAGILLGEICGFVFTTRAFRVDACAGEYLPITVNPM